MITAKPVIAKIKIDGKEIKIFLNLIIEQAFNAHHRFSFNVPVNEMQLTSGAFLIKDGKDAALNYVGKKILIQWGEDGGDMSNFNGLITNIAVEVQNNVVPYLRISGYSGSYVLSNVSRTRSFFDKDPKNPKQKLEDVVKKVVQGVMGPYCGLSCHIANDLKLPYVVQYKENVFDFLNRLAISHGEWFYVDDKTLYFGNPKKSQTHALVLGPDFSGIRYGLNVSPVRLGAAGYNHQSGESFKQNSETGSYGDNGVDKINNAQKNIFSSISGHEYLSWQPNSSDEVKQQADYNSGQQLIQNLVLEGQCNKPTIKLGDQLSIKVQDGSAEKSFMQCRVIAITHYLGDSNKENMYRNELRAIDKEAKFIPIDRVNMPKSYEATSELAEVISTEDASGRVQVRFFWNDGDPELNKSFFMPCLSPYSGGKEQSNRGILFIPEVGDIVLVGYYRGHPNHPYVMGGLHNSKTAKLKDDNKNNDIKSITTRSGHVIEFNDKQDAESITITDKNKNVVLMNKDGVKVTANEAKNTILMTKDGIKITDDNNKNSIEMSSSGIILKADKDVKITAKNITMEAQTAIEQKTGSTSVKIASTSIKQESGAGSVEIGGTGVDIKGPTIKMS